MSLISTEWGDQWIAENYPHSAFYIEANTGEVVVLLGIDEDGNECW